MKKFITETDAKGNLISFSIVYLNFLKTNLYSCERKRTRSLTEKHNP